MAPPVQRSITRDEKGTVKHFLNFRQQVHNGPLYTVEVKKKGVMNPFDDVQRYSRRYERKKQKVPKLDARPYVKELFPEELHTTLDPHATTNGKTTTRKTLIINTLSALDDVEGEEKNRLLGLDAMADEEEAKPAEEEEDEVMDEEAEDQFEEDEEGDYNAETYFEDDDGDDYGDGDDGGGNDEAYW